MVVLLPSRIFVKLKINMEYCTSIIYINKNKEKKKIKTRPQNEGNTEM